MLWIAIASRLYLPNAIGRPANGWNAMLKPQENELLTRTGPGTPMGALFRRYWIPALFSTSLPAPDCPPVRVKLLGEPLVAFRDTQGRIGLLDERCPHRTASLFFGRNEDNGLRCAYHGWKFDRNGDCVDMPTEPGNEVMQQKTKIKAYPTVELGGMVWAYMGPPDRKPPPPDYEWTRVPHDFLHVSKTYQECNYLQALEGGLDTAHSSYAHNNNMSAKSDPRLKDKSPRLDVNPTDYGYNYVSTRQMGGGDTYVRLYHYVMPFQQMRGGIHEFSGARRKSRRLTVISGRRSTTTRPMCTTGTIPMTTRRRWTRRTATPPRPSMAVAPTT